MTIWSKKRGHRQSSGLLRGILLIATALVAAVFCWSANPVLASAAESYSASGQVFSLNTNWTSGSGSGSTTGGYSSTPIQLGNMANGTFGSSSPTHSDGTHYALYSFQASGGQRIAVSMSSADFKPYLELWDTSNPTTAQVLDKNSGIKGGAPAVLSASGDYYEIPASGTYYIFADTYSAGETGSYSLTITSPTLSGAAISFSRVGGGTAPAIVYTGSDGTWSQTGFEAGMTYSAIASYNGYAFASQEFTADGNKTGINFNGMVPGIKVTAPTSGQSVIAGNTLDITWAYIGDPGSYVNIEVLQGTTVVATIANQSIGSGGTGSSIWTVPPGQPAGSDYTIRVTSASNSSYNATGSSFSVGASSLSVTAPTGGESWAVGQTYNITWSYAGNSGATVDIELLKSGVSSATLAAGVSIDLKSYAWKIASTAADSDYKIRVSRSDTGASAVSASTFTILASDTFSVSGKVVEVLTDPTVNFRNSYPAAPDLSIGDTKEGQSLSENYSTNVVGHSWYFQKYRFDACKGQKIAINATVSVVTGSSTTVGTVLADQTCANFPVNNSTYNVTEWTGVGTDRWPQSGYYEIPESGIYTVCIGSFGVKAAMNFDFTLEAPPVSGVAVTISKISGSNETFSERTTATGSDGAWSFSAVPPGSTYRIQPVLEDYVFTSQDISTAAAGLALRGCADHLEITAPTAGISWDPGTTQNICWDFWGSHNPYLKLELYKNDVWVADICQNTWGSSGDGSQPWAIPMGLEPDSDYTIKAKENGVVIATSSSFTINNIAAGGRINLSSQSSYLLEDGATVPNTGSLTAVPLRIGTQITSSYCTSFNFSDGDLYSHDFTPGSTTYTYKTNCSYYFYARAGQVFRFNVEGYLNGWTFATASFQFCVVSVETDRSYTIPSAGYPGSGKYDFSFTAPSDGTYMALPFASALAFSADSCLYNFSVDVGAPGVTVTVTSGGSITATKTTDGNGIWNLPDINGNVTYRATPSYSNWGFTPAYLDFTGSGSAYNFTANAPSISVSSPAAGVNWGLRSTQQIAWTYLGDPGNYTKIELLDSTGTAITITDAAVNTPTGTSGSGIGSYDWLIPGDITPGTYTIKVSSTDGQYSAASSQFTINNPLSVTSPVSGDNCLAGQTSTIGWSYGSSDIGTIKIELLKAGMVVGGPLTTGSGANGTGNYSWSMPSDVGSDYQIRITSEAYPAITVTSANFTVSGSYTASGHVTEAYSGPESPLSSVGAAGGPVSVPIAFGQTINGSFNSTDYKKDGYYFDCYQLALEKGKPVAFRAYQADNPDIEVSLNAGVKMNGDNCILGTYPESGNPHYGYPSYPSSGSITFSDDVFYYNETQYENIDQLCVVSVWVISDKTGPYTLTVPCPVSGAAVSFTTQSGIAAPPAAVSTDENGLWSADFDSGTTYSSSVQKDGYSAQPGQRTVDAPSADLDFTVTPNAACPAITGMTLDSLEGPAGQVNTVNISIQTSGAADGTSIGAILLTDEMRDVNTYWGSNPVFAAGTVSSNTAVMTLTIPSATPTGYYKIRAILGGTANTVSRPYQLTNTSAVPAISTVAISPDHQCTGQTGTITISVATSNVAAGTAVGAILTDGDGNPLSLSVAATSRTIANNQAALTLNVPATLPAGSYKVRVTVSASSSLVVFKDYTITAINSVSEITGFSVPGQTGASVIDTTGHTITFYMPGGSNVTKLVPTLTIDGAGISPTSGASRNFTSPVSYTVTAADGSSSVWTVTCIVNGAPNTGNDITSFSLPGQSGAPTIDSANKVITVTFTASADLSALPASFTLSDGAAAAVNGVGQTSGTTKNNFRFPVAYTVTAEDGTSSTWTINVTSSTRQYAITGGSLDDVCKATVTVSPTSGPDHSGKEAVVFQLWKDGKAVRAICMTRDIQSAETLNASFNVAGSGYTVRVVVYDSWSSGTGGSQLSDAVIL